MSYPINQLTARYFERKNAQDSAQMEAYLKNQFKCIGLKSPVRRAINREFFKEFGKPSQEEWKKIVEYLYSKKEREFHYLAMDIAAFFKKKWEKEDIATIELMIAHHSWWDTIDFIANHLVGTYLLKFPEYKLSLNQKYITHSHMWFRRVAILFQLKYKDKMDEDLLKSNILKCAHEKEFFIEKAIGWILRERSKTNPEWVKEFLGTQELRPLSIREASKYLVV